MKRTITMVVAAAALTVLGYRGQLRLALTPSAAEASESGLGSKIVFTSTQHIVPEPPPGLDLNPRVQIFIMNGDGSDPRPLTDYLGFKIAAVCSPNGRQIAFHSTTSTLPNRPTIFLMDVDG